MRTRKRKEWFPKEDGFVCSKCGAEGNCDEDNPKAVFWWDENADKITCRKCRHQLTTKQELEDEVELEEIQIYGFWLRFMSEHFIPCKKCQETLYKIFDLMWTRLRWDRLSRKNLPPNCTIDLGNPSCVTLHVSRDIHDLVEFIFTLAFVSPTPTDSYNFIPCEKCQGKLWKIFAEKEIHIGNDSKPLVELWRKWHLMDEYKNL